MATYPIIKYDGEQEFSVVSRGDAVGKIFYVYCRPEPADGTYRWAAVAANQTTFSIDTITIGKKYAIRTSLVYNANELAPGDLKDIGQGTSFSYGYITGQSASVTRYTVSIRHDIEGNIKSQEQVPFVSGAYFHTYNYEKSTDYGAKLYYVYDYTDGWENPLGPSPSFQVTRNRVLSFKYWIYPRVSYKWDLSSNQLTISLEDDANSSQVWVYLIEDGGSSGRWRPISTNDGSITYSDLIPGKSYKIRTGRYENDYTSQNYPDHAGVPLRSESDIFVSGTIKLSGHTYKLRVKYDVKNGNGNFPERAYEQEGDPDFSFTLPITKPTYAGKTFTGWKESIYPFNIYQPGDEYNYTALTHTTEFIITFEAQWEDEFVSVEVKYYWGKQYNSNLNKTIKVKPNTVITSANSDIGVNSKPHAAWGELQKMVPSSLTATVNGENNILVYYGFKWYNEKKENMDFSANFKAQEWKYLIDFVNSFTYANLSKVGVESGLDFTAKMYNDMMTALGRTEQVKPGDKVTHTIINNIATYANNSLKQSI